MNYQAVIFDMDGVIIDSESLHVSTEQEVCRQFQISVPDEVWAQVKGKTDHDIFELVVTTYAHHSIPVDQLVQAKHVLYLAQAQQRIQLFPRVVGCIKKLHDRQFTLALTTSSVKELQRSVFDRFQLSQYFDVIVTGDQITNGKPDPEPYLKTVQQLQVPAAACIVVEDAVNGIISAQKAGCVTIGITNSFAKEDLHKAGADFVVDTYEQILDIVL